MKTLTGKNTLSLCVLLAGLLALAALTMTVEAAESEFMDVISPKNWIYHVSIIAFGGLLLLLLQKGGGRAWLIVTYWCICGYRAVKIYFRGKPGTISIRMQFRVARVDATGGWCIICEAIGFKNHETARHYIYEVIGIIRGEKNEGLWIETEISDIAKGVVLAAIRFDGVPSEKFGSKKLVILRDELTKKYGEEMFPREFSFSPPRKIP